MEIIVHPRHWQLKTTILINNQFCIPLEVSGSHGTASFIYFADIYMVENWHTRLNQLQTDGQQGWLDWLDNSGITAVHIIVETQLR